MVDATCRWVRPRLPLLDGGDLAAVDARRVAAHLRGCPACHARRAGLARALGALAFAAADEPARPAAPSLWPALAEEIRESRRPSAAGVGPAWAFPWSWSLVLPRAGLGLAAASVLALAFAFFGLSRAHAPEPQVADATPAAQPVPDPARRDAIIAERAAAAMSAIRPGSDVERLAREGQAKVIGN